MAKMKNVDEIAVSDIAQLLIKAETFDILSSDLLPYLGCAYSRITGKMINPTIYDNYYERERIAKELFDWYQIKYRANNRLTTPSGNYGLHREVTKRHAENIDAPYTFDLPYGEQTFLSYAMFRVKDSKHETGKYRSKGKVNPSGLHTFLLHVGVAFFLFPRELNRLLSSFGYQELHVRNIHHLAIYTVLAENEAVSSNSKYDINPFEDVRSVYYDVKNAILSSSSSATFLPSGYTIPALFDYTEALQDRILGDGELNRSRLLAYVVRNAGLFNSQRHTVIKDKNRLISALSILFDNYNNRFELFSEAQTQYSFYSFVEKYCNGPSHKEFNTAFFSLTMEQKDKQPTREIMVLLWFYSYVFCPGEPILVPDSFEKRLEKNMKKLQVPADDGYLNEVCQEFKFDLSKFLFGNNERKYFNGASVLYNLNTTLQDKYNWGVLSARRQFDRMIMTLCKLRCEEQSNSWYFENKRLVNCPHEVDDVPYPLVLICSILNGMQEYGKKTPLLCDLYEQI